MSATATTTSGHGHDHPPRKLPGYLWPIAVFWKFIQWIWNSVVGFYDGLLPKVFNNPGMTKYSPYAAVFTCLMVGSAITVGVALWDVKSGIFLGPTIGWLDLTVGLAIATVKASLVLAFFMHLNHEASLIYRVMIVTVVFVFFMFFLCILALIDKPPHSDSFNNSERNPYFWKLPEKMKAHLLEHDGHGADAAHGADGHDAEVHATADAAHPKGEEKHAEEKPGEGHPTPTVGH